MEPLIRLQHNDHRWHVKLWWRRFVNADGPPHLWLQMFFDSICVWYRIQSVLGDWVVHQWALLLLFHRSVACPHRWLCGVCAASHWYQKHSSLTTAVIKGIVLVKVLEKLGTSGPHWAEKYVAFSILRTEIFYTAETLYVDACVWVTESIYRYKKAYICWSTCGGFNFDRKDLSFCVRS